MKELILSEKQIDDITSKLASKFNDLYMNKDIVPVFVCVLKGAAPFMHDLIKKCKFPLIIDYVQVSSYSGTESTGVIHLKKDLSENIENKEVIIIEDIIDTGTTLKYLKNYLNITYKPKDIKICCLVDKKPLRKVDLEPDYVGLVLNEAKFLVGYGFDYDELERNTPYVFVPSEDQIEKRNKILKK